MAILDTDPTHGFIRGACPTCPSSAGYAFDDNMIFAGAVANTEQWIHPFPSLASIIYLGTSYGGVFWTTWNDAIQTSPIPIFGKKACRLYAGEGTLGDDSRVMNTNFLPSISSTFTISLWLYRETAPTTFRFRDPTTLNYITISDVITPRVSGVNRTAIATGMVLNQWYFVRLVCVNGVLSCYINGVLKGTTSFVTDLSSGGYTVRSMGGAAHIKDFTICKVARDGSFVPTDILGY